MGRKTIVCTSNIPASASLALVQTITSDAIQTVSFNNGSNGYFIYNPTLTYDKNNLSQPLSLVGTASGSYNINYVIKGNYTNQVLKNHVNVEVIDEYSPNGFIRFNPDCGNFLYIYEDSTYFHGSVIGAYTSDVSAHSVSIRSDNSQQEFKIISIDPTGGELVYTAAVSGVINPLSYRYVRVHITTTTVNQKPSWNELRVFAIGTSANVALSRSTTATSNYPGYESQYAVDGSLGTRWSSNMSGSQYFTVDLTASKQIYKVDIVRSNYDAMKSFAVQGSNDNVDFVTLYTSGVFDGYPTAIPDNTVISAPLSSNVSVVNIDIPTNRSGMWKFVPASEYLISSSGSILYMPTAFLTFVVDSSAIDTVSTYYQGIGYMKLNDCIIP